MVSAPSARHSARLEIDYPGRMDRLSTFFRLIVAIPILVILQLLSGVGSTRYVTEAGKVVEAGAGGVTAGLFLATLLMILFRQHYPRWWFDFALELGRFGARVVAYLLLLTDRYPSTTEAQSVHLDVDYPDVEHGLNRWLPLVKWILALPHFVVLFALTFAAVLVTVFAWFAILLTGIYPRGLFDFVVGVGRWSARVWAYAFLLATDAYPPFSLQ